jgi:hypothetical protein
MFVYLAFQDFKLLFINNLSYLLGKILLAHVKIWVTAYFKLSPVTDNTILKRNAQVRLGYIFASTYNEILYSAYCSILTATIQNILTLRLLQTSKISDGL